jgi:hypothetical protein
MKEKIWSMLIQSMKIYCMFLLKQTIRSNFAIIQQTVVNSKPLYAKN